MLFDALLSSEFTSTESVMIQNQRETKGHFIPLVGQWPSDGFIKGKLDKIPLDEGESRLKPSTLLLCLMVFRFLVVQSRDALNIQESLVTTEATCINKMGIYSSWSRFAPRHLSIRLVF